MMCDFFQRVKGAFSLISYDHPFSQEGRCGRCYEAGNDHGQ